MYTLGELMTDVYSACPWLKRADGSLVHEPLEIKQALNKAQVNIARETAGQTTTLTCTSVTTTGVYSINNQFASGTWQKMLYVKYVTYDYEIIDNRWTLRQRAEENVRGQATQPTGDPEAWVWDNNDRFELWPPASDTKRIEIVCDLAPDAMSAVTDTMGVSAICREWLVKEAAVTMAEGAAAIGNEAAQKVLPSLIRSKEMERQKAMLSFHRAQAKGKVLGR